MIAHSPLGGPRRVGALVRNDALATVADGVGASLAEVALAWLLDLAPNVVAIPGARHPEAARSAARAGRLALPEGGRESLAQAFGRRRPARLAATGGDVVVVMGIPGAGKTRIAQTYGERGYLRLNRDDRSGSLRELPEELRSRSRREAGLLLLPTSQMRALRELEPPAPDEGWNEIERLAFSRDPSSSGRAGVFIAGAVLESIPERVLAQAGPETPRLVFDWDPDGGREAILLRAASGLSGTVEIAVCPHGAGPPTCWCRPPLPGLPLAFARAHGIEPARSIVVGASAAHRTLAATLGAAYVTVP